MEPLAYILSDLDTLIALEPADKNALRSWHEARDRFCKQHPLRAEVLPHVVEHYLSDADIRVKDQKYRELQLAEVASALEPLRS